MKKTLVGVFAFVLIFQTIALAEVVVGKGERIGKWYISVPGQKQVVVGPKESLPAIQDGSNVQVEGGNAQITTTGKSTVYLIESIPLKLSENTTCIRKQEGGEITIEVSSGQVTVTKFDKQGVKKEGLTIGAGTQVRLKDGNVDVIKGEAVLSESSGKTTKFGAGKSLAGYAKSEPVAVVPKI